VTGAGLVTRDARTGVYTLIGALTGFHITESTGLCNTPNESFAAWVSTAQSYAWIQETVAK
jgi:hypothetical protein